MLNWKTAANQSTKRASRTATRITALVLAAGSLANCAPIPYRCSITPPQGPTTTYNCDAQGNPVTVVQQRPLYTPYYGGYPYFGGGYIGGYGVPARQIRGQGPAICIGGHNCKFN